MEAYRIGSIPIAGAFMDEELLKQIHQAMWDNDEDKLKELAPCGCCCSDHTFMCCPARHWGGCGGGGLGEKSIDMIGDDYQKWYEQTRGMTMDDFFSYKP